MTCAADALSLVSRPGMEPSFHAIRKLSPDPKTWRICVVMPTRNEQETLTGVVEELRAAFKQQQLREPVIVITDDSRDDTREIAGKLGIHVVNGEGKGLGFAMQKALKASLELKPDVILTMDADGQSDPAEVPRFLEPIARNEADLVLGSRFLQTDLIHYHYRFINRQGTRILSGIMNAITGLK